MTRQVENIEEHNLKKIFPKRWQGKQKTLNIGNEETHMPLLRPRPSWTTACALCTPCQYFVLYSWSAWCCRSSVRQTLSGWYTFPSWFCGKFYVVMFCWFLTCFQWSMLTRICIVGVIGSLSCLDLVQGVLRWVNAEGVHQPRGRLQGGADLAWAWYFRYCFMSLQSNFALEVFNNISYI